uniref:Phospholipase A2 receptor 1 n=1 Tax=Neolamprologus brichardi TaxID=32507 RepID=A0A3Q4HQQ4_NEOBR
MHSLLFTAHVHTNCPTLPRFIRFSSSLNHFLPEKGLFILESEPLKQCISANRSKLVLEDCERPTRRMLWKWVSQHRLFNLGTSACLGLNISDSTQPLGMFECDVSLPVLWWRCNGNTLYGASQWRVTVIRGKQPKTSCVPCLHKIFLTSSETWHVLFTDIHTLLGNAHGMPCAFPFKYNNQWYSECTTEGREDHLLWCSTTPRYDKGERWGFCPVQVSGCEHFWESNQELRACYQFNLYTIQTWSQALSTCQAQGGNLLSITSLAEHKYIRGTQLNRVGAMVWTGLNHIKDGHGWQWSDGAPLSLPFYHLCPSDLPASPLQDNKQCGVYSGFEGHWQSLSCESALPYICKKTPNGTRGAEPLENWQYIDTECADGWWPHNGFCYRVLPEAEVGSWAESSQECHSYGANLTSIHSLSEVEMLVNLLANCKDTEVWIGLWKQALLPAVEWSDGSPVTLTLWHQYHPLHNLTDGTLCTKVDRKSGNWLLASCDETELRRCPDGVLLQGFSSHGGKQVIYQFIFEFVILSFYSHSLAPPAGRFEQAFVNSLLSESGAKSSMYYWIGLRDQDKGRKGEYRWLHHNGSSLPLTFTNWNKHQPVSTGGCVAMSGGPALGRWEVKDCKVHKALAVCKQNIRSYHDVQLPEHHIDAYAPCPPGWESNSGLLHCFKVFHSEKVLMKRSWVEADFFCQALGAQLASFQHYEEQVFVKQLLGTMFEGTEARRFWVGLNKRDPEYAGAWEWSDGSPVVTSFIDDKNEEDDRRDCAAYSDLTNTFMPQLCDSKHEWVCKLSRGKHSEPWVFYRGAEYLLAKQPFDWHAVSLACQMMGAYLLSIHSKEEWRLVPMKNGVIKVRTLRRVTILINNIFFHLFLCRWSDKTTVDFQKFDEVAVDDDLRRRRASALYVAGKWALSRCSDLHGYVCKRETVSVVETPREPHYIGGCPEKWLYFGHKCLLLHLPTSPKEGKSWNDAQSICSSFQGSLVAIEDEIEQAFITMFLQGSAVGVWIGLRDEDTMKWTNGRPVSYTNWSPHILNIWLVTPLCTVLSNNHNFHLTGKWYDEKCSESGYGFVCQKPQGKAPSEIIEYRNRNYKVVTGNLSWYDAMNKCKGHDSDLVSVTDAYHQAFLTFLVNRLGAPHWIGLYSVDVCTFYPLICYVLYTSVVCLCEILLCNKPLTANVMACPSTWVKFGHGCYSFESVAEKRSFEKSREHCRNKGKLFVGYDLQSLPTQLTTTQKLLLCVSGLHHGVIPAAVLAALLIFILLAGVMWFLYKRSSGRFQRLPTLGSAYFRQTDSQATESDGNVLIADLEPPSAE